MNNRRTAVAAALALGLAALVTACGPDDPAPAPAAAPPAATTAAPASPAPTASAAPTATPATPTTPAPTASEAVKPCHQDPAQPETVKLDSATTGGGVTKVNLTPVSCTYKVSNEEAVAYTPTGDAASYVLAKNAVVQVIEFSGKGTKERTITPTELPTYKLASTPYFTIHRDAQGKVTAMKEIYHP
ncbi:hypothetical protein KV557_01240 [Kitasatospora aureofaciens]|uniref:hypothetical protein n=1 Tax=Kitasatospora aureofaciens TaxID=1894 RepID=UPI001C495513|nr:hypothetical protein [Kitasatospora aureofaciens]MBV6695747.1 hypothetical protein [Kitasatospora aureofaciens]